MKNSNVTNIVHHYLHCALWSEELDSQYDLKDIKANCVAQALTDCNSFVEKAGSLLENITDSQIGHSFWLTRNGHGSGFFDLYLNYEEQTEREAMKKIGAKLSEICKEFKELNVFAPEFSGDSIIIE